MMMSLKDKIVSQIQAIDDDKLLKQISIMLSEDISTVHILTQKEKEAIQIGLEDVKNGRTISNEDVQKEWDSWV